MLAKIQKWGNSQGVRVPKKLLEEANLALGDEVEVTADAGRIVVERSPRIRGKYRIEDLLAQLPDDYAAGEEDWGPPAGLEVW